MSNKKTNNAETEVGNLQDVKKANDAETEGTETKETDPVVAEDTVKVKALINLKYNKTVVKAGQIFEIREQDVKEVAGKGCVEVLSKAGE
jgi:hypothetical protein